MGIDDPSADSDQNTETTVCPCSVCSNESEGEQVGGDDDDEPHGVTVGPDESPQSVLSRVYAQESTGTLSDMDPAEMDTLTMEVTRDISDCSDTDKRLLHALARLYEQAFTEVVEKNRSYGFAFIETGNEIARRPAGEFQQGHRATANGLFHRTGDKRARFYRRMFTDCDDAGEDPVEQTALEAGNYWLMMSLVAGNPDLISQYVSES